MKREPAVVLIALSMLAGRTALAQTPVLGVELRAPAAVEGRAAIEAQAGIGVTLVFRVSNSAIIPRTALTRLELPPGWQSLFASERLELPPAASLIDTVTVTPPRDAASGDYVVRYEARLTLIDPPATTFVTVHISERRQLTLSWPDAPVYIPAGEPATFELLIANGGNVTENLTLDVKSRLGVTLRPSWTRGAIEPGEVRRVQIVRPVALVGQGTRETLTATARAGATPLAEASLGFQVVPAGRATTTSRETLPAAVAMRIGTERNPGFGSFIGGGPLGRTQSLNVRFGFMASEQSHPLMLERDRNYFNLTAPGMTFSLGDQTWALSPLTEAGHYGTGVGGTVERSRWSAGAFLDHGRDDVVEGSQLGGFLAVNAGPFVNVSGQYLRRFLDGPLSATVGEMGSVRVAVKPLPALTASVETGAGRSAAGVGTVLSGQIALDARRIAVNGRAVRRDGAYPMRDKTGLLDTATLVLRPFGQLTLRGTLDGTAQIDDRTLPLDAPTRQRSSRATASWGSLARVTVARTEWTSPGKDWTGAWLRESATGEVRIPAGRIWVSPGVEQGTQTTPTTPSTVYELGWLSAGARIGKYNNVNVRGEYGRGVAGSPDQVVRRVSLGAVLRPSPTTNVTLQVQNSATDTLWFLGARSVTGTIDQELPWRHRLMFRYQSRSGGGTELREDKAYRLEYVVPFGIPLWTAADGGRVTVRLRDGETGLARSSLLLRMDNQSRLTDREGVVTFSGLKAGDYLVNVEPGSIGAGRTVVPALPLRVSLKEGGHVDLNATIIRTARIRGRIQIFQTATGSLSPGLAEMENLVPGPGVVGALLDLEVQGEHRIAVSDAQGRFSFGDVPPGTWVLRVASVAVPAFFRLEEPEATLALAPGETREVTLRLVPKGSPGIDGIDQALSLSPIETAVVASNAVIQPVSTTVRTAVPSPAARRIDANLRPIFSMPPQKKRIVKAKANVGRGKSKGKPALKTKAKPRVSRKTVDRSRPAGSCSRTC